MKNFEGQAMRLGTQSPMSQSVSIMSGDVLVKQPLPVLPADAAMNPDLCLQVREHTLQGIVCSWKSGPGIFLKHPEPLHVAPNAQVCAPETGTHVRRCFLFYPPVLDTLVQNVPVPRIPVLEGGCERPAVHFCDAAHKIKKVPRCIQLGILREVAPDYKHLVELTSARDKDSASGPGPSCRPSPLRISWGLSFNVFNLSGAATCPISFLLQTPQILDSVSYSVL